MRQVEAERKEGGPKEMEGARGEAAASGSRKFSYRLNNTFTIYCYCAASESPNGGQAEASSPAGEVKRVPSWLSGSFPGGLTLHAVSHHTNCSHHVEKKVC
jgi:hypothetical protein